MDTHTFDRMQAILYQIKHDGYKPDKSQAAFLMKHKESHLSLLKTMDKIRSWAKKNNKTHILGETNDSTDYTLLSSSQFIKILDDAKKITEEDVSSQSEHKNNASDKATKSKPRKTSSKIVSGMLRHKGKITAGLAGVGIAAYMNRNKGE